MDIILCFLFVSSTFREVCTSTMVLPGGQGFLRSFLHDFTSACQRCTCAGVVVVMIVSVLLPIACFFLIQCEEAVKRWKPLRRAGWLGKTGHLPLAAAASSLGNPVGGGEEEKVNVACPDAY